MSSTHLSHPRGDEGTALEVVAYLEFAQRFTVRFWSKEWNDFAGDDLFARWLCLTLGMERKLYVPPRPPPGVNWRGVFKDLWPLRTLWQAVPTQGSQGGGDDNDVVAMMRAKGLESLSSTATAAADAGLAAAAAAAAASGGVTAKTAACNIGVIVRFRPETKKTSKGSNGDDNGEATAQKAFFLPLHQRLQLIRARDKQASSSNSKKKNSLKPTVNKPVVKPGEEEEEEEETGGGGGAIKAIRQQKKKKAALIRLQEEGGWFGTDWKKAPPPKLDGDDGDGDGGGGDASNSNGMNSFVAHIHDVDPFGGRVVAVAPGVGLREFQFDHVLNSKAMQSNVYEAAARSLLTDFLNGISATILVYGQTGSGKSYTMFGEQPKELLLPSSSSSPCGIKNKDNSKDDGSSQELPTPPPLATSSADSDTSSASSAPITPARGGATSAVRKLKKEEEEEEGEERHVVVVGDENVAPLVYPDIDPAADSPAAAAAAGDATATGVAAEGFANSPTTKKKKQPLTQEKQQQEQQEQQQQQQKQQHQRKLAFNSAVKTLRGIVPRAAEEVLIAVEGKRNQGLEVEVTVSYVEVFGDEVSDLLKGGAQCGHSKVAAQRYVLSGATGVVVDSVAAVEALLEAGEGTKRRAATAMNERSSRAHSLFIMTLEQKAGDKKVTSQLFLADLGGSEQVKRSEVHHGLMSAHHGHVLGDHMREAVYINLGLLALKKCIEALNKGHSHVPYQDSKLTMLLSPALGGASKASVVVCGSMDQSDAKETVQALRFGEACSRVENSAKVGAQGAAALLEKIEKQIEELEQSIKSKERWETSEVVRQDELMEEGTFEAMQAKRVGGEVVKVGVVVGAEVERCELEKLIVKRAELLGEDAELKLAEAGFGGQFGAKAESMGGHAALRFANKSQGLKIKGKVIAEWEP